MRGERDKEEGRERIGIGRGRGKERTVRWRNAIQHKARVNCNTVGLTLRLEAADDMFIMLPLLRVII